MASFHCLFSSSSCTRRSSSILSFSARSASIAACSFASSSASCVMAAATAASTEACPRACVSVLSAPMATSRISSNCTFSTTRRSSGTRSGPNGATSPGRLTRRDMFSITMDAIRLLSAIFSLSPRERMGHSTARVEESTAETKVVPMSFSSAATVSVGFIMAFTTAGTAGATSVLLLHRQHASRASCAARTTCCFVSHTCALTLGTILGNARPIMAGSRAASCTSSRSAACFVRQSVSRRPSTR
mmetsp:Transcript_1796/g.3844  ORF Transcript_1796/g.3844 Transcript_1796/m.3844 type:complete len:245 (-) Transcript_1796:876-1610(-)